ncbi:hypothetical protein CLD04_08935 [Bacillus subtilis]|nr:hypothetical protein CLD04_08935 [Bacillus subtilis]
MNTVMQAIWGVLLQKYNNSNDVVFGSVVSGRPEGIPGIENMIGMFINTIPVRVQTRTGITCADLMQNIQELAISSSSYDTYPLYEIQAQTKQKQDLVQHIMVFENYPVEQEVGHGDISDKTKLKITNFRGDEHTNYDFNVLVMPGREMQVHLQYNANVYSRVGVEQIKDHLIHLMNQVVQNPNMLIEDLQLITKEEEQQILQDFNDTKAEYPRNKTIHQLFEEQAERVPDKVAVVFEDKQLTYRGLNERANRLARTLRNEGVEADQLVGIMAERSLDMIVGILGILKAGGAYVPIDPEYPEERIHYMLEDSKAHLLLTQSHLRDRISFAGKILSLDEEDSYDETGSNLKSIVEPHHLAYVIYTSGTTGKPKGVMVEHRGLCNLKTYFKETCI